MSEAFLDLSIHISIKVKSWNKMRRVPEDSLRRGVNNTNIKHYHSSALHCPDDRKEILSKGSGEF